MTAATKTTTDYRQTVQAFCSCFVTDTRRTDGSRFVRLNEACRYWRDEFRDVVRNLHDGELPNDWRYERIELIANELLDLLQGAELGGDSSCTPADLVDEISCDPDIYNSELLSWLEIGDRWGARDPELISATTNVASLVQQLQTQELEWMARRLCHELQQLTEAS